MKKTLFTIYGGIYPRVTGGMEVFNYYLIRELASKGWPVAYSSYLQYNHGQGMHFRTLKLKPLKLFWPLQDFFILLFNPSIKNLVVSYSEAHWLIWYLFTLITRILHRNLIIVLHHGKSVPADHFSVYQNFFQTAKTVVAVSHDIKRNYDNTYKINCEVIYPLVPFNKSELTKEDCRKKYGIPTDAIVISMVGTLKDMKNPDTLIKAIASMSKSYREQKNIIAVFAGNGSMTESLKQMTETFGVADRTIFLGQVPKESVCEVMRLTDIYLIASDFEGTSVSLLEAMYNKKSIIVSRAPGLIDMVQEGTDALCFKTRNAEELKECICKFIENPKLAITMSDSAYHNFQDKYCYNDIIHNYSRILG